MKVGLLLALSVFVPSASASMAAEAKRPERVSHKDLHKLASTGMRIGKQYEVTSKITYISSYYLCDPADERCDSKFWISVEDDSLSVEEKRSLYDLREHVGCFRVAMLTGWSGVGSVYLQSLKPGVCEGDQILQPERNPASTSSGGGMGLVHYFAIGAAIGFILQIVSKRKNV